MFILVTGANSQIGMCLKDLYEINKEQLQDEYVFCTHKELDITNPEQIQEVFEKTMPDVVINCAAYTNVDGAEDDFLTCNKINCFGVENLLEACKKHNAFLITFSSDYVYEEPFEISYETLVNSYSSISNDTKHKFNEIIKDKCATYKDKEIDYDPWAQPWEEDSFENRVIKANTFSTLGLEMYGLKESSNIKPKSKYALSKYLMETICRQEKGNMVIRTSWLYSQYGKNFMKTIVKKLKNNEDLTVVDDQFGRPTNANDLAQFVMFAIIANRQYDLNDECEIINFQNDGAPTSWYGFAQEIKRIMNDYLCEKNYQFYSQSNIIPCLTDKTKYKADRPYFSVMDIHKAGRLMHIPWWKRSLEQQMKYTYIIKRES